MLGVLSGCYRSPQPSVALIRARLSLYGADDLHTPCIIRSPSYAAGRVLWVLTSSAWEGGGGVRASLAAGMPCRPASASIQPQAFCGGGTCSVRPAGCRRCRPAAEWGPQEGGGTPVGQHFDPPLDVNDVWSSMGAYQHGVVFVRCCIEQKLVFAYEC